MKVRPIVVAFACSILFSATLTFGHHSFASEFSLNKPITMTGTVTKLDWINPHCYLALDTEDRSGNIDHWQSEFGAPVGLRWAG